MNYQEGFRIMGTARKPELVIIDVLIYGRKEMLQKWNYSTEKEHLIQSMNIALILYQYEKYSEGGDVNYRLDDLFDLIENDIDETLEPKVNPNMIRIEKKMSWNTVLTLYVDPILVAKVKNSRGEKIHFNDNVCLFRRNDTIMLDRNRSIDKCKYTVPKVAKNMIVNGIPCDIVILVHKLKKQWHREYC
jgi:hypothetical protein